LAPAKTASAVVVALVLSACGAAPFWQGASLAVGGDGPQAAPLLKLSAPSPAALRDYAFLRDRVAEEYGWDRDRAEGAIVEYLRFLQLLSEAPRRELIASSDVDLVWHEHIMDSENYAVDCNALFGRFLHHRRARTPAELAQIPESYSQTKRVYAERFGVAPPAQFWGPSTEAASMCGGGSDVDPNPPQGPSGGTGGGTSSQPASTRPSDLDEQRDVNAATPRVARAYVPAAVFAVHALARP